MSLNERGLGTKYYLVYLLVVVSWAQLQKYGAHGTRLQMTGIGFSTVNY